MLIIPTYCIDHKGIIYTSKENNSQHFYAMIKFHFSIPANNYGYSIYNKNYIESKYLQFVDVVDQHNKGEAELCVCVCFDCLKQ